MKYPFEHLEQPCFYANFGGRGVLLSSTIHTGLFKYIIANLLTNFKLPRLRSNPNTISLQELHGDGARQKRKLCLKGTVLVLLFILICINFMHSGK